MLVEGLNQIQATGSHDGVEYTDQVVWNCTNTIPQSVYPEVPSGQIQINFEKTATTTPAGYLKDDGSIFGSRGNGYSYGWNVNNTANNRERGVAEKRFDTFVQMQTAATYNWTIDLANQWYKVSIAAGDPNFTDSNHKIEANGVLIVNYLPTTANKFGAGTAYVKVTDGKMLVKPATGSTNAKISFIHITPVSEEEATTSVEEIIIKKNILAYVLDGKLNIENNNGHNEIINLYNQAGQLVLSKVNLNNSTVIPIPDSLKGVVLLQILSDKKWYNLKVQLN
jgi:hypothetical protein